MTDQDLLTRCGDNAAKWAEAFCQMVLGVADEGVMISWFANAIEEATRVRQNQFPEMLGFKHAIEAAAHECDLEWHRLVAERAGRKAGVAHDLAVRIRAIKPGGSNG